jgi:putative endonuclease
MRITEHYLNRENKKTFCGRYLCYNLVYYEEYKNVVTAIAREKEIKKWRKEKKLDLIRSENKDFVFLNETLFDCWPPVSSQME